MKKTLWLPLAAGLLLTPGCGTNKEVASTVDPAAAVSGTKPNSNVTTPSDPKEVVQLFLDSMREGNGAQLSNLLSTLAREEIKRKKLEIAPLGSPLANFKVNEAAEQEGGMLVSSTWTEPDQPGQPATELEVVWELRKEPAGWRICGMAVDPKNGDEVQIVDFEKLEPDQPTQDPQFVAALPNASPGMPAYTGAPASNYPPNSLPPSSNFAPNANGFAPNNPQPGFPPAGNYGPAASGNFQPANSNLPPATGHQPSKLPPANYPGNQPANGLPQPNSQYGNQNQLPPIVPGNFNLPPAGNPQPASYDSNQIRR